MIVNLIFGFMLVFAGRSLFWLSVGIIGFLIGVQCASLLGYAHGWESLASALALGCIGAILAVSFEWFMAVFGIGFLGGGYLLMNMFSVIIQQDVPSSWLVFVIGGIVGMCMMVIFFDWSLIIISSLLGATLIVNTIYVPHSLRDPIFFGCVITGIFVQFMSLLRGVFNRETSSDTDSRRISKSETH